MQQRLAQIALVVRDYDEAIEFYTKKLDFKLIEETEAKHILSKAYTGAYLGVYTTSNGEKSKDYADFDWVSYKGFEKY